MCTCWWEGKEPIEGQCPKQQKMEMMGPLEKFTSIREEPQNGQGSNKEKAKGQDLALATGQRWEPQKSFRGPRPGSGGEQEEEGARGVGSRHPGPLAGGGCSTCEGQHGGWKGFGGRSGEGQTERPGGCREDGVGQRQAWREVAAGLRLRERWLPARPGRADGSGRSPGTVGGGYREEFQDSGLWQKVDPGQGGGLPKYQGTDSGRINELLLSPRA